MKKNPHRGSSLIDFLKEHGIYKKVLKGVKELEREHLPAKKTVKKVAPRKK